MTENNWATWLRTQLDNRGWSQADLVRNSDGTIKADRVSKWLSGKESPSHRFVLYVANTLDVGHAEALDAAGYDSSYTFGQGDREAERSVVASMRLADFLDPIPVSKIISYLTKRIYEMERDLNQHNNVIVGRFGDNEHPAPEQMVAYEEDGDTGEDLE